MGSMCHLPRYPRKKFWIGKPIARVLKKKTSEFSDKLLSLQRGLREFQGEVSLTSPPGRGWLLISTFIFWQFSPFSLGPQRGWGLPSKK